MACTSIAREKSPPAPGALVPVLSKFFEVDNEGFRQDATNYGTVFLITYLYIRRTAQSVVMQRFFTLLPDVGNASLINAMDTPNSVEQKCIGR
jgi:hypothetical protein